MRLPSFRQVAALILFALVLAACSAPFQPQPTATPRPTAAPRPTVVPTPEPTASAQAQVDLGKVDLIDPSVFVGFEPLARGLNFDGGVYYVSVDAVDPRTGQIVEFQTMHQMDLSQAYAGQGYAHFNKLSGEATPLFLITEVTAAGFTADVYNIGASNHPDLNPIQMQGERIVAGTEFTLRPGDILTVLMREGELNETPTMTYSGDGVFDFDGDCLILEGVGENHDHSGIVCGMTIMIELLERTPEGYARGFNPRYEVIINRAAPVAPPSTVSPSV